MTRRELKNLLKELHSGNLSVDEVMEKLTTLPFQRFGKIVIDTHRAVRTGFPEIIYAEGKSIDDLYQIIKNYQRNSQPVLITRVSKKQAQHLLDKLSRGKLRLVYNENARIVHTPPPRLKIRKKIPIITAGASDIGVAKEAAVTCRMMGVPAHLITDVGVAGIHRLSPYIKELSGAPCSVVVAGMEGALPGVVAGITGKPVIGVPTSAGYGVAKGGFSALLTMLSSCALNLVTVNIDDGVGAGFTASLIALGDKI